MLPRLSKTQNAHTEIVGAKISISGLLFTSIPVLQILFLRKAINFSALLLIVILFVGFFSVCCICVYHLGIKRILDNVADVMFVITCIGLVLYFTGQVLHIVKPLGRIVYSWGGAHVASSWFSCCSIRKVLLITRSVTADTQASSPKRRCAVSCCARRSSLCFSSPNGR